MAVHNLIGYCVNNEIDILCVQETRLVDVFLMSETLLHWTVHHTPADARGHGGVTTFVSFALSASIVSVETIIPHRCHQIWLKKFSVVNGYSPHSATAEHEAHMAQLASIDCSGPLPVFLLGDFNAESNTRTQASLLLDGLCQAAGLVSAGDALQRGNWTWRSPNGLHHRRIDHILFPVRWRSSAKRIRVVTPPHLSDHRLVAFDFKITFAVPKEKLKKAGDAGDHNFDALSASPALRDAFSMAFRGTATDATVPTDYPTFLARIECAATQVLPTEKDEPELEGSWLDPYVRIWDVRANNRNSIVTQDALMNAIEDNLVRQASDHIEAYIRKLNKQPWLAWKHVFALKRKEHDSGAILTADDYRHHFESLMRPAVVPELPPLTPPPPPQPPPLPFLEGDFTEAEFATAVSGMSNHKAVGPDQLHIEVFRCIDVVRAAVPIANHLFHHINDIDSLPQVLLDAYLTPIYKKKGDRASTANYRPVVLLSHLLKIVDRMVLLRMRASVDSTILPYQAAYRERRSCIQHILTLHQLQCKSRKSQNLPLYTLFVDFSRAFDSVDRERLGTVLRFYSVPETVIAFVLGTLQHQRLYARGSGGVTADWFTPSAGVMQGDTLAPFLFDLVIDYVLRHLPYSAGAQCSTTLQRHGRDATLRLPCLAYADDIALLSNSAAGCQLLLRTLERAAHEFGLRLNMGAGKTEVMITGDREDGWRLPRLLSDQPIPEVRSYKYLGWHCDVEGTWETDFAARKKNSWFVLKSYDHIWKSTVNDSLKQRLFYSLVIPVLTYAAATYPPTLGCRRKLHTVCNALMRRALNTKIFWKPEDAGIHTHTAELYATLPTVPTIMAYQFLSSWGHWVRDTEIRSVMHCVVNVLSTAHKTRNHKRGTRHMPASTIDRLTGLDMTESYVLAQDRSGWRANCFAAALAVERNMYDTWILPRRIHGVLEAAEHSRVLEGRRAALSAWLVDRRVFD